MSRDYKPKQPVHAEELAAGLTGPDAGAAPGGGLTARQQAFCRAMLRAATAAEAARIAGYAPENARNQASRLLRDPRITQRIARLRRALRPRPLPFLAPLMGQLDEIYERALASGEFAAAIRAVEAQAQLLSRFGPEAAGDWVLDNIDQDALEEEAAALEQDALDDDPDLALWEGMNAYTRNVARERAAAAPGDAGEADANAGAEADTDAAGGQQPAGVGPAEVGPAADARPTNADASRRMPTFADRPTAHAANGAATDGVATDWAATDEAASDRPPTSETAAAAMPSARRKDDVMGRILDDMFGPAVRPVGDPEAAPPRQRSRRDLTGAPRDTGRANGSCDDGRDLPAFYDRRST